MNRKSFLRGLGLFGVGTVVAPKISPLSAGSHLTGPMPPNCVLIPSETAGPFPLDLSENQTFFRQDVREDRTGAEHTVRIKVIGQDNCLPMPNVRVNIWHCDKDGNYSGYSNQSAFTYLRGYQWTDANGEVSFTTVFPGWYPGRICHIHFQVWVSSVYAAISQLTYPIPEKNQIYADHADLYTKGVDPLSFNQDGIFADGYAYQLATLTTNAETGVYESYLEVTVQGTGITGLAEAEPETGGQFTLLQNHPNPFLDHTTIPFQLNTQADVTLELWDLQGRKLHEVKRSGLDPGRHEMAIDFQRLGLLPASYVYQLVVQTAKGRFTKVKRMTCVK